MSSDTMISVENVGKLYTLKHKRSREGYTMLRDVITQRVVAPFRAFSGKQRSRARSNATSTHGSGLPPSGNSSEEFWAIKDVSFKVERGDEVGIIGLNGAGKSTRFKILSRITEPTKGRKRRRSRVGCI